MIKGAGIAWYTPATWRQLRAVAGDTLCCLCRIRAEVPRSIVRGFRAQGIAAEKVLIDVDHMAGACKRHGYPIGCEQQPVGLRRSADGHGRQAI